MHLIFRICQRVKKHLCSLNHTRFIHLVMPQAKQSKARNVCSRNVYYDKQLHIGSIEPDLAPLDN